ncbi:MAG: 23S rRNA (guanosine(2251)-2'-O)-methyltransferase RlmB [Bacteroidota bacterium]
MQNNELIFGIRTVIEAVKSGKEIDKVMINKSSQGDLTKELISLLNECSVAFQFVPIEKINHICKKNHQGVVAFISPIAFHNIEQLLPSLYEDGKTPLFLILDEITDVRNFGAIARTAECAGVHAIIIPQKGSAQINSDAIKVSSGAIYNIPVCKVKSLTQTLKFLKDSGVAIVAATEKAEKLLFEIDFNIPVAIMLGSEESGINVNNLRYADELVKIPLFGDIESLNVSASTSVFIYEAIRQRYYQK